MHNLLLLGSGGREHALAFYLSQSPLCHTLYTAPGNAGTALCGENIPLDLSDFDTIKKICLEKKISLIVVGPEVPLVEGIVDFVHSDEALQDVLILGPDRQAAQLEGSKSYAKEFMDEYGIPTASYKEFGKSDINQAIAYLKSHSLPVVIKADGLAAGKGVVIAQNYQDAERSIRDMLLEDAHGDAGHKIVIEEYLDGIEMSCFILTDGTAYYRLPDAKDYKRIGEGDTGPNTGGMGAISPVPFLDDASYQKINDRIIEPTLRGIRERSMLYRGVIFLGLMNVNGDPYVIEYNCRFGDPETEVILGRIEIDLLQLIIDTCKGEIDSSKMQISSKHSSTVMLVSEGYPGSYEKGYEITGWQELTEGLVLHAGTTNRNDMVVTNGGRVLAMSALADTLQEALNISYKNAEIITFDGKTYRKDIGNEFI